MTVGPTASQAFLVANRHTHLWCSSQLYVVLAFRSESSRFVFIGQGAHLRGALRLTDIDSVDAEDSMTRTNLLNTYRNSRKCASMNGIKCSKTRRSGKNETDSAQKKVPKVIMGRPSTACFFKDVNLLLQRWTWMFFCSRLDK